MKDVLPVQWREFYCYDTLLAGIFFEKRSHCVQKKIPELSMYYVYIHGNFSGNVKFLQ